jgi:hypothetical protein
MTPRTYRQTLSDVARRRAAANGEPKPSKISFVRTTRQKANNALGSKVNDDRDVYLVQVTGEFTVHEPQAPAQQAPPSGKSMTLIVDASTGQVIDWGVAKDPEDISALGTISSL